MPEPPAQAQVRAVYYGQPIPPTEVVYHHCHDLDAPTYRCFATEAERDIDAAVFMGGGLVGLAPLSTLSGTYALAYTFVNYGGNSLMISAPIPDLGVLGWSNTISSFKSTNGGRPKWWDFASYSGSYWQWGVSYWVPDVGDDADNRFTSVKNVL